MRHRTLRHLLGGRRALSTVVAAVLGLVLAAAGLVTAAPASAATTQSTFLTFYGWYDNTPPGGAISYPKIHSTAGGTGTYADPITFASYTGEIAAGTVVYVPRVQKYFIMEDSCEECQADWTGKGPNGGPNLRHLDLWIGGNGGNEMAAIDCEDALTDYNADNTPTMEPVIVSPPSTETVSSEPLFNINTGRCYGGAQATKTVGQYKNNSTGTCMDDPGDSSTSGTALKLAPCSGAAEQQFTFEGAFLYRNNLCANISGSSVTLVTCTGGPNQQLSVNPDLTIDDIQSGSKCLTGSGTSVVSGGCPGGTSAKWTFIAGGGTPANDFSVSATPSSASVAAGATATATIATAVTAGSAESVTLSATGGPAGSTVGFSPASVTSGAGSTLTVATTSTTAAGTYPITVTGTAASGTHTTTYTLTVTSGSGGCTSAQLLKNPGFESGATSWTQTSTLGFSPITNDSGQPAHAGSWKAWMDGNSKADTDSVAQTVTIPAGCKATLSFWLHVDTTENTTTAKPDTLTVQLLNGSTVLTTVATFSNLNKASGYSQHTYDVSAYAGQTLTLKFTGKETDANGGTTDFVVDDTALQAG